MHLAVDANVRDVLPAPWRRRLRSEVARMARAAAKSEGRKDLDVSLRLCDDATIHALNRNFRRKDKPTDVLAFAMREGPAGAASSEVLGDIVISLPTARRQAKRRGVAGLHAEVLFLAAHGLAHLLGYDHQNDRQEAEMNARMAELLEAATGRPFRYTSGPRGSSRRRS
jgi:probable rRNA maturation factor